MGNPTDLADRYVALWNEPDPDARRAAIGALWATEARHILQAPQEVVKTAAALGLTTTFEAHGHDQLAERVRLAYEEFVAPGQFTFRRRDDVVRLRDVLKFTWEMVATSTGEVAAVGMDVLVLDVGDQIRTDYQFVE